MCIYVLPNSLVINKIRNSLALMFHNERKFCFNVVGVGRKSCCLVGPSYDDFTLCTNRFLYP